MMQNGSLRILQIIEHKESATKIHDLIYTKSNHVLVSYEVEIIPHLNPIAVEVREKRREHSRVVVEENQVFIMSVSIRLAILKRFSCYFEWLCELDLSDIWGGLL